MQELIHHQNSQRLQAMRMYALRAAHDFVKDFVPCTDGWATVCQDFGRWPGAGKQGVPIQGACDAQFD
jgi:hypothetical protein